ncbi:STAS domain-containing protein [Actinomycetospora sp. TBRC 11914]|uniref:STAS domain-containing protein n=1 Tax=Actinomycetospora sp. TBRC 11914 TaxID=2729387 RepID=UPI00145FC8E6|nr:STAS domain-containing protein [Actinomycetospora sp. TBRC 11914]NMO89344.1 hypothetical protein [Actinomycetospora sp. TBRC 11914]
MQTDDDQLNPPPIGEDPDPGPDRPRTSTPDSPPGARLLRAGATLDSAAAAELRREARALLARSADPVVVDLTAVRAAEPAAASSVLRELAYEAGDADVDLRIVRAPGAPEVIRAVLDDESLFEIFPSLDAALRPDGGGPPSRRHPGHPPASGGR